MSETELEFLIAELSEQQVRLQFTRFTNEDAWELGSLLYSMGRDRGLVLTVDIRRHGQQLFHAAQYLVVTVTVCPYFVNMIRRREVQLRPINCVTLVA